MSIDILLRDIFKLLITDDIISCYLRLGYKYLHMYELHTKYNKLRLMPRNNEYYTYKQKLKVLRKSLRINNEDYVKSIFYTHLKKNV